MQNTIEYKTAVETKKLNWLNNTIIEFQPSANIFMQIQIDLHPKSFFLSGNIDNISSIMFFIFKILDYPNGYYFVVLENLDANRMGAQ